MEISSIDDLLAGVGNSQQPATPEHKEKSQEKTPVEEGQNDETVEEENIDYGDEETSSNDDADSDNEEDEAGKSQEKTSESNDSKDEDELDDYGNKKERMPKGMKERLDRKEKQHKLEIEQRDRELQALRQQLAERGASREVQQAVKDFQHNPNEDATWEQQLQDFVKQTVSNMHTEEQQRSRDQQERASERAFAEKFQQGMDRFSDFREVVAAQPIDDAMTLSLRGMADPSAFIYAASKRHPQELERIAKLPDPYARMVEMGKLEERMRRNKPTTKTPRPLGRTREDATAKVTPKQPDLTGDDLLAKADAKRLSTVKNRLRANR